MGLDSKPPQAPLLSQRVSFRVQIPSWGILCSGSRVKKVHLYRFRLRISKRFIQFWGSVLGLSPTFCAPNMEISAPPGAPPELIQTPKAARKPPGKKKGPTRIAAPRLDSTEETDGGRRSRQRPEGTHRPSPTYRTTTTTTTTTSSAAAADLKKKIW